MWKRVLVLVIVAFQLTLLPPAQATAYRFAHLNWRVTRSEAQRTMAHLGWRFLRHGEYGDVVYSGQLKGYPAQVTLKYDLLARLAAVDVRVQPTEGGVLGAYRALQEDLTRRYGPPVYSEMSFRPPYREGDGQELEALKRRQALFDTVWFNERELNVETRSGVQLEMLHRPFSRLEIRQFYLSNAWTEEYQRRSSLPGKTF